MFDRGLEQLLFSLGQLFLLLVRFPNSQLRLRSEYKRLTAEQCCVFCNNLCLYSQYYLQSQRIFLLCLLALGGLLILMGKAATMIWHPRNIHSPLNVIYNIGSDENVSL